MKRLFLLPTRRVDQHNNNNNNINNNNNEIGNNNNNIEVGEVLREGEGGRVDGPQVDLSTSPKNLHELWAEYTVGLGGRKAAKYFTPRERGGRLKFRYCRRKIFWDCVSKHVNAGYAVDTVIDRIHSSYGEALTVTAILNALVKDRRKDGIGGHPNLRI